MAGKPKKIVVWDTITDITYELEGSLEDAIDGLQELKDRYESKYLSLSITIETYYAPYDHDGYPKAYLKGEREETDEEYEARLAQVQKYKDREREQYEKLKEKFEGKK
jgi:hypothetical protein